MYLFKVKIERLFKIEDLKRLCRVFVSDAFSIF
jgi:hypothetical protein